MSINCLKLQQKMQTPSPRPAQSRIVVARSISAPLEPLPHGPCPKEALDIADAIAPHFADYAGQYDEKKYWPEVYAAVLADFARPKDIRCGVFQQALMWKYGHLGKDNIPHRHELLAKEIEFVWPEVVTQLSADPGHVFKVLDEKFGGGKRFITVAFIAHLLVPDDFPIIDQHNFRAVNDLMSRVRPSWKSKKKPSRYRDLEVVAAFINEVAEALSRRGVGGASRRELDKFLMMYGKAIKPLVG